MLSFLEPELVDVVSTWESRLDMRRCARRARALRGNLKALDSRSRAGVLMSESYHESVSVTDLDSS